MLLRLSRVAESLEQALQNKTAKVARLLAGESYIKHVPSEWIGSWLQAGQFTATAEMQRLAEADAVLICVPTPLTDSRDPDLSYVESTANYIAAVLRPGQLIVASRPFTQAPAWEAIAFPSTRFI